MLDPFRLILTAAALSAAAKVAPFLGQVWLMRGSPVELSPLLTG